MTGSVAVAAPSALLDTDTLSEIIRGRDAGIAAAARDYVASHGSLTFSIITRYEILRGLRAKGAQRQLSLFDAQCRASEILPLTDDVIVTAADIYAHLYRGGQLIGDADTLIAATAMVNGLVLVTNNVAHYQRVPGLTVARWRAPT
jgi:tRNA(fMet)-specific endonuclease VapC